MVLAHAAGGMTRARQLLGGRSDVTILAAGGGAEGLRVSVRAGMTAREALYVIDVGVNTLLSVLIARARRVPVIVDTGDLAFALARSKGSRSFLSLLLVGLGEQVTLRLADVIVIRGRRHANWLPAASRWVFIPDIAPPEAGPAPGDEARRVAGIPAEAFVVGLVGSLNSAPRHGLTYGWDLVESLPHLPPNVHALVVGDGEGRPALEDLAEQHGVAERCHFVGRRDGPEVPRWIGAMDVAISTQTNDAVGAVRTTGKVPLYLRCGCPIIATDVGEAHDVLGPCGWVLPYHGRVDVNYPARIAAEVARLLAHPEGEERRRRALELSREHYDEQVMRERASSVVDSVISR